MLGFFGVTLLRRRYEFAKIVGATKRCRGFKRRTGREESRVGVFSTVRVLGLEPVGKVRRGTWGRGLKGWNSLTFGGWSDGGGWVDITNSIRKSTLNLLG